MVKYTNGELHANGETLSFTTPEETKSFRLASDMKFFKSTDGTKEYGFSNIASMFAVLTIDTTASPLADKPNCDNYGDCPNSGVKGGDVTVKYVDEASPETEIASGLIISGNIGDTYITEQKEITGYTFKEVQGPANGTITEQPQTVTYVYTKDV